MKRILLSLLVLLMTASTGAWAGEYLYLGNINTSEKTATLMCSDSAPESGIPYFDSSSYTMGWKPNGYTGDIASSWTKITIDTSCQVFNGQYISTLFKSWTSLTTIENIGNLNTSNVRSMSQMFSDCSALTALTFGSYWSTANVEDMEYMFYGCSSLTTLDLSSSKGWSTSEVVDMDYMFSGCSNLETLNISGWNTPSDCHRDNMFSGCVKLYKSVTLNLGDEVYRDYWATFYDVTTGYNYEPLTGIAMHVFKVKLDGTAIEMTEITNGVIMSSSVDKSQGVVLKYTVVGSSTPTYDITLVPTIATADYTGNSLVGTTTEITNPGNAYVLNYKEATGAGFYKLKDGIKIGANKAYLTYTPPTTSGAREYFLFDDEKTGIEAIDNGQLTVDNVVYDLQGRCVVNPTKGLYIVNGKKVVIK